MTDMLIKIKREYDVVGLSVILYEILPSTQLYVQNFTGIPCCGSSKIAPIPEAKQL